MQTEALQDLSEVFAEIEIGQGHQGVAQHLAVAVIQHAFDGLRQAG